MNRGTALAAAAVLAAVGAALALRSGRRAAGQAERVADFRLTDASGAARALYDYGGRKAVVLLVQGNGCPIFQKSVPKIRALRARFEPRGAVFLALNANPGDEPAAVAREAADFGLDIPVLLDRPRRVAGALGLTRTAEALLLDTASWRIVYRGAIDDSLGYDGRRPARQEYLADALDAVLSGRRPAVARTEALGCLLQSR